MACRAYSAWHHAQERLQEEGYTTRGRSGPRVSPWWRIAHDAAQQHTRLMAEYGLSPAARTRIQAGDQASPPAAPRAAGSSRLYFAEDDD